MTKPLRVLSLGAGVQSTTLLLLALEGELPKPDLVVFADTGWEPAAVYRHLAYLEGLMAAAGLDFRKVGAGNIREDALAGKHGYRAAMPFYTVGTGPFAGAAGTLFRQCTMDYKIKPIRRAIRACMKRRGEKSAELWMGISLDEVQRTRTSDVAYLLNRYPLIERRMTRGDCLAWMAGRGYPEPPRSACVACPFRSDAQWRVLAPSEFADAVAFDAAMRHLPNLDAELYVHRSRIPLSEVDLSTEQERGQLEMWGEECAGVCGV